ncbi:hypothetical protein [Shewanella sp.]|uniref:hypothetical protein n=1 Tax=Shewanella sp. TaxID=50422 RepID=UPI0040541D2C
MAHCKIANAITTFSLPLLNLKAFTLSSLWLLLFSSNPAQADEPRVSFSQGYQLNHSDRHTHRSARWLTPRYNSYDYHGGLYPYQGSRLYPYATSGSSLSISWSNSPYYQNRAAYRHPRLSHWNGFEDSFQDSFQDNYAITPWRNNWHSPSYRQAERDEQTLAVQSAPISQVSTQMSHSKGLTSLPANARVVQQENGTAYEWQGMLYRFDWGSQTYQIIKEASTKKQAE